LKSVVYLVALAPGPCEIGWRSARTWGSSIVKSSWRSVSRIGAQTPVVGWKVWIWISYVWWKAERGRAGAR
jgi:hypothetical protein